MCRPRRMSAAARRSSIRPLVQEPRKTVSTWISRSGVPARQVHVLQRPLGRLSLVVVGDLLGVGNRRRERQPLTGIGAPGDERGQLGRVEDDLGVEHGVVVGDQRRQYSTAASHSAPVGACGRPWR